MQSLLRILQQNAELKFTEHRSTENKQWFH